MSEENVMTGFDWRLYSKPRGEMTERERLQIEIAYIINTSVYDARSGINDASLQALREALKLSNRKTLNKLIQSRIKKLEKGVKA